MNFIKIGLTNQARNCLCRYNANVLPLNRTNTYLIKSVRCCSIITPFSNKPSPGNTQGTYIKLSDLSRYNRTCNHIKEGLLKDGSRSSIAVQFYSVNSGDNKEVASPNKDGGQDSSLNLFQRFKALYRDYWYILVPVHFGSSIIWFGIFYYMAESGVDIIAILEQLKISDRFLDPLKNGHLKAGYLALAVALYKLATPVRYAFTLGGTTVSINYLKRWGYIKPIPSRAELKDIALHQKQILMEKRQNLIDKKDQIKENVRTKKNNLMQKKNQIKENVLSPLNEVENQGKNK